MLEGWVNMAYTFDEFFDEISSSFSNLYADNRFSYTEVFPPTNQLIDKDKNLILQFALAGYSQDELSIDLLHDIIDIKGTPKEESSDGLKVVHQRIKKMTFERKYALPAGRYDLSKASAKFENGLLTIIIPASEAAKPTKLTING